MSSTGNAKSDGASTFSEREREAMKARAAELKAEAKAGGSKKAAADEAAVLKKIAGMEPADRAMAERVHGAVTAAAPDLAPKLWYGQPAYAAKGGKVVCFFRSGHDDGERYSTFGFTPNAALDDGAMWPSAYALTSVDDAAAEAITELVARAVG